MQHDDGIPEVHPREFWKARLVNLVETGKRLAPHNFFPSGGYTRDGIKQKVRRVDTGEVFDSLWAAAKTVGMRSSSMSTQINRGHRCRGVLFERVA
jgi:hypothetical protein